MFDDRSNPHPVLAQAAEALRAGDSAAAERALAPLMTVARPHVEALHLMGVVRQRQNRLAEAASLLAQAVALAPQHASAQFFLGKTLSDMGRHEEALAPLRAALAARPGMAVAEFALGVALQQLGRPGEAESVLSALVTRAPHNAVAKLALGSVLTDLRRPAEAEILLRAGLAEAAEPGLKLELMIKLAIALRLNAKGAEALTLFEQAQGIDPRLAGLDLHRAEILQDLKRYDESLALYRAMLAREPLNVLLHHDYNDLLYRLGRSDYLKSYDTAPDNTELQLAKAGFLMHEKRGAEAHDIYDAVLRRAPDERRAAQGRAVALMHMGRLGEAARAFEALTERHGGDAGLHCLAAAAFIRHGDPARAVNLCEQGLRADPGNNGCLATLGTALRVMGDERDEVLNGYDSLIQVFDLEPPDGFSDMAAFNAELCAYLDKVHPDTREHVSQTLRGGSQTSYNIFGGGHDLVDRLQRRIGEALARYIAGLEGDDSHPFLKQRRRGFAYAGSWSSRLKDCGFHVNHIHGGWISSCYYAGVPEAVADETQKQGWIKFGEPDFEAGLSFRRAVQPAPGRLVLFPSYMWHGTIPFRAQTSRLTIAFDAVPR